MLRAIYACCGVIPRLVADFLGGFGVLEAEVGIRSVAEKRVGKHRVLFVSLAPLGIGLVEEFRVFCAEVPIDVVVIVNLCLVPRSAHNLAAVGKHNVVAEGERAVSLNTGELQRLILSESQNVVADDVVFAVVLVECAALAGIHHVVVHAHAGAALVGVKAPAAVVVAVYVVNVVVVHASARRYAQGVYGAHIR